MANLTYNSFKGNMDGNVLWDDNSTTTIKAMLVTGSYVPDKDLHEFIDDVTNESSGTGYTAGGKEVLNRLIAIDNTLDLAKYDANDITWSSSTVTARGVVLYKDTGTPSTSPLIMYIDFGENKSSTDGDFSIFWHENGIFTIT